MLHEDDFNEVVNKYSLFKPKETRLLLDIRDTAACATCSANRYSINEFNTPSLSCSDFITENCLANEDLPTFETDTATPKPTNPPISTAVTESPAAVSIPTSPPMNVVLPTPPPQTGVIPTSPPMSTLPPQTGSIPTNPPQSGSLPTLPPQSGVLPTSPPQAGSLPTLPPQTGALPTLPPQSGVLPTLPPQAGSIPTNPPQPGSLPTLPPQSGAIFTPAPSTSSITTSPWDFESGVFPEIPWRTGGNGVWTIDTENVDEGMYSIKSPDLQSTQTAGVSNATLTLENNFEGGLVRARVLASVAPPIDVFIIYVDGVSAAQVSTHIYSSLFHSN